MGQIPSGPIVGRSKPGLDIYGIMLIIATVFVAAATIFILVRSQMQLGSMLSAGGE